MSNKILVLWVLSQAVLSGCQPMNASTSNKNASLHTLSVQNQDLVGSWEVASAEEDGKTITAKEMSDEDSAIPRQQKILYQVTADHMTWIQSDDVQILVQKTSSYSRTNNRITFVKDDSGGIDDFEIVSLKNSEMRIRSLATSNTKNVILVLKKISNDQLATKNVKTITENVKAKYASTEVGAVKAKGEVGISVDTTQRTSGKVSSCALSTTKSVLDMSFIVAESSSGKPEYPYGKRNSVDLTVSQAVFDFTKATEHFDTLGTVSRLGVEDSVTKMNITLNAQSVCQTSADRDGRLLTLQMNCKKLSSTVSSAAGPSVDLNLQSQCVLSPGGR